MASHRIEVPERVEVKLCNELVQLQREIWGMSDVDILPPWALLVTPMTGNFLIVAYGGDVPVGLAVLSRACDEDGGVPYLYIPMMGVHPDHRNQGVAERIMDEVKRLAARHEFPSIKWTYDPLEASNANLYIRKAGARVKKYYENYYGELSGKDGGDETDRFWAELTPDAQPWRGSAPDSAGEVTVEIPDDYQTIKDDDAAKARELRMTTRHTFQDLFVGGFEVRDFYRDGARCFYVLTKV